ncbi:hypothetical protein T03_9942 [Trichinella britovi]|uniref:Uncharacterized protein n=1 Tax=Trichinella britovi TaxID=45882 RepID=A0A0V1CN47_TRIBR|nr:hypothetical protein T03_9942 [Trichinella britovi]
MVIIPENQRKQLRATFPAEIFIKNRINEAMREEVGGVVGECQSSEYRDEIDVGGGEVGEEVVSVRVRFTYETQASWTNEMHHSDSQCAVG